MTCTKIFDKYIELVNNINITRVMKGGTMKKFLFEPLRTVRRSLILDTDIGPDCDDVGALAVMYILKRHNTK